MANSVARVMNLAADPSNPGELVPPGCDLKMDLNRARPMIGGAEFKIVGKQLRILVFLARHKDTVVSKEMLLDHLYASGGEPDMKIIDVFICKLRKKLKAAMQETGGTLYIETVWGRGYVLRGAGPAKAD